MLTKYDNFFAATECESLITEVMSQKDKWKVNNLTEFRIVGDNFLSHMLEHGLSSNTNYNDVGYTTPMHTILRDRLLTIFPTVEYTKTFPKPGFVVRLPEFNVSALWHYDNELSLFPFQLEFPDYTGDFESYFEGHYSFIIMLSDGNYSFNYFPQTLSEYKNTPVEEMNNAVCSHHVKLVGDSCTNPNCPLSKYETIQYKQGTLLAQHSRVLHRGNLPTNDDRFRIIVRAYGVVKHGVLYLFW